MKVFMTGGTGFMGTALTEGLLAEGHSVTILSRSSRNRSIRLGLAYCEGNPAKSGPWQKEVARHDVVINLAGASIFRTWNAKNKKAIRTSRIHTTRKIVDAIGQSGKNMTLDNKNRTLERQNNTLERKNNTRAAIQEKYYTRAEKYDTRTET